MFAVWFATLLAFHAANSYILLTADLEDVQAIAQKIISSPVVEQLDKIWRRASSQFSQELSKNKAHKRADDSFDDNGKDRSNEDQGERRSQGNELDSLGQNASYYLRSIKKIFENI